MSLFPTGAVLGTAVSFAVFGPIPGTANAVPQPVGIATALHEQSVAYDMNPSGQVAGVIVDDNGNQRAIFYDHGKLIEIGQLGGGESEAKHINRTGQVIGSATRQDHRWRGYLYDEVNGMQEIGTLGGKNSHGAAVNDLGVAVGYADTESGEWHAFIYKPGSPLQDLGTLGGKISFASGINNRGQVVGTSTTDHDYRHAFLYDPARGMVDLGTLGGRTSYATSINDAGMVVGASEMKNRRWHAFEYDGHRMIDLGALIGYGDSFATGINNAGHAVGSVVTAGQHFSFVWRDNQMTLHEGGPKGLYLTNAINNVEEVVGATYDRGFIAAFANSAAPPYRDPGGTNLLSRMVLVMVMAGVAVVLRKRYKGIHLRDFS